LARNEPVARLSPDWTELGRSLSPTGHRFASSAVELYVDHLAVAGGDLFDRRVLFEPPGDVLPQGVEPVWSARSRTRT